MTSTAAPRQTSSTRDRIMASTDALPIPGPCASSRQLVEASSALALRRHRALRRTLRAGAVLAVAVVAVVVRADAGERWEGLHGLPRVAIEATVTPNHPDIGAEDMRRRLEETLKRAPVAPIVEPTSPDRLQLLVAVRAYSSSELRGFYLPLSQAYGIGPVRLIVERPAQIAGLGAPIPAQVWQAERQAKAAWRNSGAEILELADEVIAAFLVDYRRATGR